MNEREKANRGHYVPLLEWFGARNPANGYSEKSQRIRFNRMIDEIGNFYDKSILDVGCGWGELLDRVVLRLIRSYHGIDILEEMIDKHIWPHIGAPYTFECIDLFDMPDEPKYNYVIANGTFNVECGDNDSLLFAAAERMFGLAKELTVVTVITEPKPLNPRRNIHYYPEHVLRKTIGYLTNRYKVDRSYHDREATIYLYKPS